MNKKQSFFGIDVIKMIAIVSVVSVHFLLNTKFYNTPITDSSMVFQIFYRQMFIVCVPLFLIATGFLQLEKTCNKSYFKGLLQIIYIYVILSVFVISIRIFYFDEQKSIADWILNIFNFSGIRYAWYVEMYIGLALLIPFLNLIWKGLKTKKEFQLFLVILMFITSFASFWNVVNNNVPYLSSIEFPDFWTSLYPVTYYFIGVYIRKYEVRLSPIFAFMGFLLFTIIQFAILWWKSKNVMFSNGIGSHNSILIVIQSTFLFLTFYKMQTPTSFLGKLFVRPISSISLLTFDIFLVSAITDKFVYQYFLAHTFTTQSEAILYAPICVISSFLLAYFIALVRSTLIPLRKKYMRTAKL